MNGKIWIENVWTPRVQRIHGQSLMSVFARVHGSTNGKLKKANFCRMYAKCITLSDITNNRGEKIPGGRMEGQWRANSTLVWPKLPPPPKAHWAVFRW